LRGPPLPSIADLQKAYEALQWSKAPLAVKDLSVYAQWVRLDSRLGELLINHVLLSFNALNPFLLWRANCGCPFPQVLPVVLEFAIIQARMILGKEEQKAFQAWCKVVTRGVTPAPTQMFFIDGRLNPTRSLLEAENSLKPFLRWGFFSSESLLPAKVSEKIALPTLMPKANRLEILRRLLTTRTSITVADYMRACSGQIHRRTAERDLSQYPQLKRQGFTRNRSYRLASPRASSQ